MRDPSDKGVTRDVFILQRICQQQHFLRRRWIIHKGITSSYKHLIYFDRFVVSGASSAMTKEVKTYAVMFTTPHIHEVLQRCTRQQSKTY
ncbi:hypothetical protein Y032_0493g2428 [Ancylostoma ceylanicum]|uniref:Uncharacterized protein n=1 Tax=Ancylostoma ceylanicum TaxID=53326 RepID=A0A016WWN6_9BILA|nr:hypothetical protein Y032_0493g2428 [Ancylostoma ceylanicum]